MIPARFRDFLYRSVFNRAVFKRTDARRRNLKQRFSTETLERKALLTTFFVTNTDDAGAGSLRDAVAAAEVSTVDDNDSIEFNLAPGSTILLTSGQIEITDNLFFNGPGSDALTIDAGGNSRIFDIVEGEDEFLEVGIGGMTLTNGSADDGGAVRNSFASVFMADVVLSNNTASQRGGAIYTEGESFGYGGPLASLYLDDVDITGNSAVDGGGIYNDNDHVELENDSTVTGNMASNNGGGIYTLGQGGGIEVGTLFVYDGSTISDNVAGNDGGGIYNENDHVELWNGASLNNNVAGNRGGGAYTFATGQFGPGESFYVTDSEIAGNTAVHGGGIFNEGDFVRLFRATVRDNTAAGATDGSASSDGLGGGIYHMAIEIIQGESSFLSGDLDVDQSTISNNVAIAGSDSGVGADGYGGGIYTEGFTRIDDSLLVGNRAEEGASGGHAEGGAIWNSSESLSVRDSTVSANTSDGDGGGIYTGIVIGGGSVSLSNITVTLNQADADGDGSGTGGGLSHDDTGSVFLDNSIIAGNLGIGGAADDAAATVASSSDHNLIGVVAGLVGVTDVDGNPINGNLIGTAAAPLAPVLGPLQDNAGSTHTHALLVGSPAINAGDSFSFRDQRGMRRPSTDTDVDIGAYEYVQDFGDAPSSYPVTLLSDGARHTVSGLHLGDAIDSEFDGQTSTAGFANRDDDNGFPDDEDGITFVAAVSGFSGRVEVSSSGDGFLNAWIDIDGSGTWEATEQIITDITVSAGLNVIDFNLPGVPAIADFDAIARFRLDSTGGLTPTGLADDGEVEDYALNVEGIVLPDGTSGGFTFTDTVPPRIRRWYDPDIAIGYEYQVNEGGDNFTSIELVSGFGDDIFTLDFTDGDGNERSVEIGDFDEYDFEDPEEGNTPGGVSFFRITGIESDANLDPDDPNAFATGLSFGDADNNGEAIVDFTMTPLATPVANDDVGQEGEPFVSGDEDTNISSGELSVLDNDTDRNLDDELTAELVEDEESGPFNGTVVLSENGTFVYTPDPDFFGDDSFTYMAFDGLGYSDPATVFIEVLPVNDAPVALPDTATTDEDTQVSIDVLDNDFDVDLDTIYVYNVDTEGTLGTVTENEDGTLSYMPPENYFGTDTFAYHVIDRIVDPIVFLQPDWISEYVTVTVTINPVNDAPVAVDDDESTDEDTAVVVDLLANDSDVDNDISELTVGIVSGPTNGSFDLDSETGVWTYTPADNFNGTDEITYTLTDPGEATSDVATITINVAAVNDAPVANDDETSTDEDEPVTILVVDNDTDVEQDDLTPVQVSEPENGSVVIDDGTIVYTPDPDFNGTDTFTYFASDGDLTSAEPATVTVTVNPVNDAPVAEDDSDSTDQGVAVTIDVLGNDSDVDNDDLTPVIIDGGEPDNGTVEVNVDGTVTYTPDEGFTGEDSFSYVANDGSLPSNVATVTITVIGGQTGPVRVDDGASFETIQAAIDHAASVAGPNSIEVDPGVYPEDLVIDDSAPVILVGLTGGGEEGEGDGVVRVAGDGDGSAPIIQIHQLSDVTLQNILVRGSSGHAIQAIAATDASEEGEGSGDVPTLTLIDVSLLSNDGDGLNVEGLIDVSIQGGRFNNNDGDGIDLSGVGDVLIDGAQANRNDPGLLINGAASVSVSGSVFNNNADGGIVLVDIAGDVDISTTVTNNNDADGDNNGDGILALDGADADDLAIGGSLEIEDSRFQDTDGADSARNQVYGVHVPDGAGVNVILIDNTATGNAQDGARIVGTREIAGVQGGNYSRNRDDGVRILRTGTTDVPASFFTVYVAELTANGNGEDGVDIDRVAGIAVVVDVRANDNGHDGVQMDHVRDIAGVAGVTANNNGEEGIDIEHSAFADDAFVIVIDSTAHNNGADGVEIGRVGDVQIGGVRANGNGDEGLDIERAREVSITESRFNNNSNGGIEIDRIAGLEMDDVRSNGNGEDGIDVQTVSGAVDVTNTFANDNADEGVQIFGVGGTITLESVAANRNGDRGLWIRGAHDVDVTDSVFNANDTRGADIERACDVILTGLRANNNGSDGVRVYRVWDVEIDESRANGNGVDGFHINRARDVSVANSRAQQNGDDGFQVFNSRDVEAIDSFFSRNDDDGFQVINSGEVTLERVTADRNGDDGIQVRNSGDVTATASRARNNGDDGLQVINSGLVIISGGTYSNNGDDDIDV